MIVPKYLLFGMWRVMPHWSVDWHRIHHPKRFLILLASGFCYWQKHPAYANEATIRKAMNLCHIITTGNERSASSSCSIINNTKLTLTRQSLNNNINASIHIILLKQNQLLIISDYNFDLHTYASPNKKLQTIQAWHLSSKSRLLLKCLLMNPFALTFSAVACHSVYDSLTNVLSLPELYIDNYSLVLRLVPKNSIETWHSWTQFSRRRLTAATSR